MSNPEDSYSVKYRILESYYAVESRYSDGRSFINAPRYGTPQECSEECDRLNGLLDPTCMWSYNPIHIVTRAEPVSIEPLRPELMQALQDSYERNKAAYDYLGDM